MSTLQLSITPGVTEKWDTYSPNIEQKLASFRQIILEVAEEEPSVERLEETLK